MARPPGAEPDVDEGVPAPMGCSALASCKVGHPMFLGEYCELASSQICLSAQLPADDRQPFCSLWRLAGPDRAGT